MALDTAGGYIIINGAGFISGVNVLLGSTVATSVTRVNSTQLRVQVPALTSGSYSVYATNPDGGLAIGLNILATSNTPVWSTGATLTGGIAPFTANISLAAIEGSDSISYSNVGALPSGLTLAANGLLTGTLNPNADTTYNFTVRATDDEEQDADRVFSVTILLPVTFAGTYAGNTVNVGLDTYGMSHGSGIQAGNNLVISTSITASGCTFGPMGQFATIVAHNKQGNVAWSISNIINYNDGMERFTSFYGIDSMTQYLSSQNVEYYLPTRPSVVDSQDNVYFAFNTRYDTGANSSLFITKYNSSGQRQWINRLRNNYSNSFPVAAAVEFNKDGDLFVLMYRNTPYKGSVFSLANYGYFDPHLLTINSTSGSVINDVGLTAHIPIHIKLVPNTNNIVLTGENYTFAAIAVANTTNVDSYSGLIARRFMGTESPSVFVSSDIHPNGAIFALGQSSNGKFLNVTTWASSNLNNGATYSWNSAFANTDASRRWVPSTIKYKDNYLYVAATESGTGGLSNSARGYIFRLHASNGAIDYQRVLSQNSSFTSFILAGLDIKEDKMYITGTIEESNTADGRSPKMINLVLPSNGYSNSSSSANIQYQIPGIYSNNKIVYAQSSLSLYTGGNAYSFGDACSGIGFISSASNNMLSNTTANNVYDLLANTVHYDSDSSGGYYRAAKITNTSSNTVMLSF